MNKKSKVHWKSKPTKPTAPVVPAEASPPQQAKPKLAQNAEVLHFFNSEYARLSKVMSEAFLTIATCIEKLPDSFSKAVALRHLLETRDWTARAEYIRPVKQWVAGQPNVEFMLAVADEAKQP